jgi:hypothetical protein
MTEDCHSVFAKYYHQIREEQEVGKNSKNNKHRSIALYFTRGKAIHLTDRGGPYGCETPRLPHFLDNRLTDGSEVVRLTRRPHLTTGRFLVLISVRG